MVDGRITPTVAARANSYPQLRVIEGNFGDQEIADKVGNVDALFLFDVLLRKCRLIGTLSWICTQRMYVVC